MEQLDKALRELVDKINNDKYGTLEGIINTIINSNVIKYGLFIIDFPGEKVRSISRYEKLWGVAVNKYTIIVARKTDHWYLEIPTKEQIDQFFFKIIEENII